MLGLWLEGMVYKTKAPPILRPSQYVSIRSQCKRQCNVGVMLVVSKSTTYWNNHQADEVRGPESSVPILNSLVKSDWAGGGSIEISFLAKHSILSIMRHPWLRCDEWTLSQNQVWSYRDTGQRRDPAECQKREEGQASATCNDGTKKNTNKKTAIPRSLSKPNRSTTDKSKTGSSG